MVCRPPSAWLIAAGILCGCAAAAAARAESPGFLQPPAGARLEPGIKVEVAWRLEEGSLTGFDESELLLSLDGGRSFPLRFTPEVSPETRRLFWRVPALPTEHARLALRAGLGEEAQSESIRVVGPEFAIAARPGDRLEELFRVGAEWRTREALSRAPDLPDARLLGAPAEEMRAGPAPDAAAAPPKSIELDGSAARPTETLSAAPALPKIELPSRLGAPVSLPLRQ